MKELQWKSLGVKTFDLVVALNYSQSQDIWDQLWFSCKAAHCGKVLIAIFGNFFPVLKKFSFARGHWALGYHSLGSRHFSNIS